MKLLYKIFRSVVVTLLVLAILLPATLYILLSLSGVQRQLKERAEKELTELLDTEVSIGSVELYYLPSRLVLNDIAVKDRMNKTALGVRKIDAGIELRSLLETGRIIINYAEIQGLDARIYRQRPGEPLNIDHIIKALQPKDDKRPPTQFDFRVGHLLIRNSSVTYDVLSAPAAAEGRFDVNHVAVNDLNLNLLLPRIKNDDFTVMLRQLSGTERSGLRLSDIQLDAHITNREITVKGFSVRTPVSTLLLGDMAVSFDGYKDIARALRETGHSVVIKEGTVITPSEFAPFLPALAGLENELSLSLEASGSLSTAVDIRNLKASMAARQLSVEADEAVLQGIDKKQGRPLAISVTNLRLAANAPQAAAIAGNFVKLAPNVTKMVNAMGSMTLRGDGRYDNGSLDAGIVMTSAIGTIDFDGTATLPVGHRQWGAAGKVSIDNLNLAPLVANQSAGLGSVTMDATVDLKGDRPYPSGSVKASIASLGFKGYNYSDIDLDVKSTNEKVTLSLDLNDPHARLTLDGHLITSGVPSTQFYLNAANIDFAALNLSKSLTSHTLSFKCDASLQGTTVNNIDGWLRLNDVKYISNLGKGVDLKQIDIESECSQRAKRITVNSDILEGKVSGSFNLTTVAATARDILGHFIPALVGERDQLAARHEANLENDFNFDFTIKNNSNLERMFKLPFSLMSPVTIKGMLSYPLHTMSLDVDVPYVEQSDKLITGTSLSVNLDGLDNTSSFVVTTNVPTKRGELTLNIDGNAVENRVNTQIDWIVDSKDNFIGDLNFTTSFERKPGEGDKESTLLTRVNVNPGTAVFNDTVWEVAPSAIDIQPGRISVDHFMAYHDKQSITLNGIVANDTTSVLWLALRDIDLDYIFSTLNISDNIMFGGHATGDFYASGLLAGDPRVYTPLLQVNGLSYNHCVMGDGTIRSRWVPSDKSIHIDADIAQADSRHSHIKGLIRPATEELDFHFDADHAQIGFLQPFMAAFCSDIQGEASGNAHLYGTFKLIDMTGDLFADSIKMKLDFTNVYYTASDSVHIRPGRIEFEDIVLSDPYGNTGLLSGWLKHECFKKPVFEFNVRNVDNMLVYDVPPTDQQRWYGRVFGNGNASVTGRPGLVNIGVNMTTAPNSTFTFVLSDAEVANDYTFIAFRDRDKHIKDSIAMADPRLAILKQHEEQVNARKKEIDIPSTYLMKINVNVTPQAKVNLIMDPIGGDEIKATGQGTMTMEYDSSNEDLKMRGTYTLNHGSYNFTLQDIIIKDFTIEPGSSITFNGDPYAAQLNITAAYALNANLTDLDESFAQDKELNRTNVPVHALLIARGDMRQPEISFDLSFPTLTQDTYRKVKSIVSTDEMMNTQIIYLLALNRFYTPDYMASTTKGNELVSVASSTISSQLSSILGNLSDNWSIAPNFRSDRGDFSDVEFDVALSSNLLNNRLLLNGNFGYRDKSLNNNSFIGDFDAEYLLNRSGTVRLKAYNRYNDQNFYVKSALTTQGIGVVFKRDFDNIFSFMRPVRRWLTRKKTEPTDSVTTDSIPTP